MVLIFSATTSLLAEEYVESFPAEKLAVALFKISKDTGVSLRKEGKSFMISGNWSNVIDAYASLQQRLTLEAESIPDNTAADLLADNFYYHSGKLEGIQLKKAQVTTKPYCGTQRGRKPGSTVDTKHRSQSNLPEPVVIHHGGYDEKRCPKRGVKPDNVMKMNDTNQNTLVVETRRNAFENNTELTNNKNTNENKKILMSSENQGAEITEIIEIVYDETNVVSEPADSDTCIKVENNRDDFGSDTDIDEQYLPDSDGDNGTLKKQTGDLLLTVDVKTEKESSDEEKAVKKKSRKQAKNAIGSHNKKQKSGKKKRKRQKKQKVSVESVEDLDMTVDDIEYNCSQCDYKGKKKSNLREHVRRMHGEPISCDKCNKVFGLKKDLSRHRRQVHTEPTYFCDICGKLYKFRRAYKEHMLIHKDDYVKPNFPCEICEKTFSTKYVLTSHVNSVHLGMKKSFVCPTCGRSFTQKNSYLMHANVHAGIKPFVCDVCGKAFSYDKSLKEHKYMHDTERRFKCHICSKTFRQKASLQIHSKVHKETRDYICQSCGKGFTQKQALHRHERIHSGDKPFKCALCARTFNDYSIIRRHMIMLHKRNSRDTSSWKHDIVCTMKRKTDFYIEGGPGYNSGERVPSEIPVDSQPNTEHTKIKIKTDPNADVAVTKGGPYDERQLMKTINECKHAQDINDDIKVPEEALKEDSSSKQNYSETQGNLHQLARAAFPIEKSSVENEQCNSPSLPINYSLPADYSAAVRTSSAPEDSLSRYQSVMDTYRPDSRDMLVNPSVPQAAGNVGHDHLRGQLPHPTTADSTHPQTLTSPWVYNGYPYYNPANFQHYPGPNS